MCTVLDVEMVCVKILLEEKMIKDLKYSKLEKKFLMITKADTKKSMDVVNYLFFLNLLAISPNALTV